MQVFLFNELYLREGERFTFLPKNAHPNANAILSFQMKREIAMHPNNLQSKYKRDLENI